MQLKRLGRGINVSITKVYIGLLKSYGTIMVDNDQNDKSSSISN